MVRLPRFLCLLFAAALVLSACSPKAPAHDGARAKALADAFINDLPAYTQAREDLQKLLLTDACIVTDGSAFKPEPLEDFYAEYEKGGSAAVTVVSAKSAFVVTRVVFEEGAGYYLRSEYDPEAGDNYTVAVKYLDTARLVRFDSGSRLDLELSEGKKQIATISVRNIMKVEYRASSK